MKISIPKVVRPIRLSDYAPEFGEQVIGMWVNPSREKRLEFNAAVERGREARALFAALVADDDAIARHTKDSTEAEKDHQREFSRLVLDDLENIKELDEDERAEQLADAMKRIKAHGEEVHAWYAEMWSQGEDKWTTEEVSELVEVAVKDDPKLWDFIQESSLDAMSEYRTRKK